MIGRHSGGRAGFIARQPGIHFDAGCRKWISGSARNQRGRPGNDDRKD